MHEFAICQELVEAALAEMARLRPPAIRLRRARLVAGALRQLVPESLTFAFEVLTRGTPAEGAELEIVAAPVIVACRQCGRRSELHEPPFLCAACGAPGDITGGAELCLESMEIEQDDGARDQGLP